MVHGRVGVAFVVLTHTFFLFFAVFCVSLLLFLFVYVLCFARCCSLLFCALFGVFFPLEQVEKTTKTTRTGAVVWKHRWPRTTPVSKPPRMATTTVVVTTVVTTVVVTTVVTTVVTMVVTMVVTIVTVVTMVCPPLPPPPLLLPLRPRPPPRAWTVSSTALAAGKFRLSMI